MTLKPTQNFSYLIKKKQFYLIYLVYLIILIFSHTTYKKIGNPKLFY